MLSNVPPINNIHQDQGYPVKSNNGLSENDSQYILAALVEPFTRPHLHRLVFQQEKKVGFFLLTGTSNKAGSILICLTSHMQLRRGSKALYYVLLKLIQVKMLSPLELAWFASDAKLDGPPRFASFMESNTGRVQQRTWDKEGQGGWVGY